AWGGPWGRGGGRRGGVAAGPGRSKRPGAGNDRRRRCTQPRRRPGPGPVLPTIPLREGVPVSETLPVPLARLWGARNGSGRAHGPRDLPLRARPSRWSVRVGVKTQSPLRDVEDLVLVQVPVVSNSVEDLGHERANQ